MFHVSAWNRAVIWTWSKKPILRTSPVRKYNLQCWEKQRGKPIIHLIIFEKEKYSVLMPEEKGISVISQQFWLSENLSESKQTKVASVA